MNKFIRILLIIIHSLTIGNWSLAIADEYRLAPCDQLEIKIIGQNNLDTKQSIAPDGTISLPLLGPVTAQGQTIGGFTKYLSSQLAKYIKNPQIVIYLTPRPIYIVQHDKRENTWEVKEAKSIAEATAFAGKDYEGKIKHGDVIAVDISKNPDFWEDNWYKIITGAAVLVGIYVTLHR